MKRFILGLLSLPVASMAWAIDLKGHQFTDSYRYSVLEDTNSERFAGKDLWLASLAHVNSPFYYVDSRERSIDRDIIEYNDVLTLGYTRYVSEALALGVDAVAVSNRVFGKAYSSLGDVNLRAKYRLTAPAALWNFSLNPYLTLPTGKDENFTTAEGLAAGVRLVTERHWNRWHVLASLGYAHAPDARYLIVDQTNLALTQLGVSYDLTDRWNVNAEVVRNFTLASDEDQNEGDYFLTLKHKTTKRLALYAGLGLAGVEEIERNHYTAFVGLKFHEEAPTADPGAVATTPPPIDPELLKRVPKSRKDEELFGRLSQVEDVFFGNNSFVILDKEKEKLLELARRYRANPAQFNKVVIEGFASTRGNKILNERLALDRTKQAFNILKGEGIPELKMSIVSYGDYLAVEKEEWKNRKVQFRVYKQ